MILFEDKDIIVCHKPAGLPVQSARVGQKDMVSMLNNHLAEQSQKRKNFVHVVHRLDQPVEGVIVFAKNQKAAANLTRQMQQDGVKKVYQAVCCTVDKSTESEKSEEDCGKLSENQADCGKNIITDGSGDGDIRSAAADGKNGLKSGKVHLEDYLVKDGRTNTSRTARKGEKDAKLAILDYEVLAETGNYKLVQVYLKTGRHHQIRVQMAHAGFPLYGDQKYNKWWKEFSEGIAERLVHAQQDGSCQEYKGETACNGTAGKNRNAGTGLALCAVSYSFQHPMTGKQMKFEVKPENPVFGIVRK